MTKILAITFGMLATASLHAADLFYKKNLTLHVIHDVDQGKSGNRELDTSVGKYSADAGAVLYIKGQTLYLIRDTRDPKPVSLDSGVADLKLKDGLIAYIKNGLLYVRRFSDAADVASRRVTNSKGVSSMHVAGGTVVFLKNVSTLYRVTDHDRGIAERLIYPVQEAQVSGK